MTSLLPFHVAGEPTGIKLPRSYKTEQYRQRKLSRFNYRDHYTTLLVSFAEIPKERSIQKEKF